MSRRHRKMVEPQAMSPAREAVIAGMGEDFWRRAADVYCAEIERLRVLEAHTRAHYFAAEAEVVAAKAEAAALRDALQELYDASKYAEVRHLPGSLYTARSVAGRALMMTRGGRESSDDT